MANHDFLQEKFKALSDIENQLREHFEGMSQSSRFSLDGQIIGAFAEQIIAEWYGLTLCNKVGYDATTSNGRKVEIKVRRRNLSRNHLRNSADDTILLYYRRNDATEEAPFNIQEVFNGTVEDFRNEKPSTGLLTKLDNPKQ